MPTTSRKTAARKSAPRNTGAPAPTTTAVPALGRLAASERIGKAERIFVDVMPRVTLSDGRVGGIQRETRADGSAGPLLAAFFRPSADGRESAQRYPLSDVQVLADALMLAQGVALIAAPETDAPSA